jgi:mannose-6-phosphate isomerase-like protein (cupin superfamily)
MANTNSNDSIADASEQRQKIQIFHARDARSMMELGIMSVEFPPEVKPLVAEAVANGLIAGDEVKVLFSMPGFSLLHAWLKKDYPLAAHTHDADCLYWIVSGALQYGDQTLRKGDGFFVPANVPYVMFPLATTALRLSNFGRWRNLISRAAPESVLGKRPSKPARPAVNPGRMHSLRCGAIKMTLKIPSPNGHK